MEPIFRHNFTITDNMVNCYGYLKPSMILYFAQEVAGLHCNELRVDYDTLANMRMFWAVTRHKFQISRMPMRGETITIETWPMPTTRVAYPRSMICYDAQGNELFRSISIWVLMDLDNRNMILPGKSGIEVNGTLRGTEPSAPKAIPAKAMTNQHKRTVCFTDLDRNGHMNNTRYLEWIDDLLPSTFHKENQVKEFTLCYLSEAREGQELELHWDMLEEGILQVDIHRKKTDVSGEKERIFSALIHF